MKKQGSGWKGESRRHSLARKGIKTTLPDGRRFDVSKFVAKGEYNYWEQMYDTVMNHVKHYQNDFLVHDKKMLEGVDEFIMGIRESGTDTYIMDYREDYFEERTLEQLLSNLSWVLRGNNDRFFWGKDGEIVEITKEEAEELMNEQVHKYNKFRKVPFTDFPSASDSEIYRDAKAEINDRRYYGVRDVRVEPKKFYTRLFWSNSDAKWHSRKENYMKDVIQVDANEVVLPYRVEEVNAIIDDLPPLPLYIYSYEHTKRTAMTDQNKKQLKKEWIELQGEQFRDKGDLL